MGWHGLGDTSLLSQATWDQGTLRPTRPAQQLLQSPHRVCPVFIWYLYNSTYKQLLACVDNTQNKFISVPLPSHCWCCPASKQWNVVKLLFCRVSFPDHSLPQTPINAYNNWVITSQVVTLLCKIVYQNTNKEVGTLSLLAVDHHQHTSTCKLYTEVSQVHPAPPDHWVTRPDHWVSLVVQNFRQE